ncbi:DUF6113 family protein [Luteimicrobium subarcticum]|uniref:Uncharacterized protein n=1 Tax=Luteimicrobium subarcticum TaxID=620910 RepID=A0A2M8WUK8_9MICO|nr:DUF6113 family protein [Luteimicrobium subarcticum]PJI94635.1 hypothetical protein CLV34_0480 [Luteimicrobium subarcticum]
MSHPQQPPVGHHDDVADVPHGVTAPDAPVPGGPERRRTGPGRTVLRLVGCLVVGAVVGTVGTVMFQASYPVGLILAIAATLAGSVTARAWGAWSGLTVYALGWMVATGVLAFVTGPGGDVIVPAHVESADWLRRNLSNAWLLGGVLAIVVTSFLPWSWFADESRPRRPRPL